MKLITLNHDLPDLRMSAGLSYLMDDQNAGTLLQSPGLVRFLDMAPLPRFDFKNSHPEHRILIVRPGGIGDLLQLTPLLRFLSGEGRRVTVSACRENHDVVPLRFCNVIDYPIPASRLEDWDAFLALEDLVEMGGKANEMHMADLYLDFAGVNPEFIEDRSCWVPGRAHHRRRHLPPPSFAESYHIGIHAQASAPARRWSRMNQFLELVHNETEWHLHLYGAPGEVVCNVRSDRVHNHSEEEPAWKLADTLDHMQTEIHGFVGVDSGLLTAAGGMGVPSVGIFASFRGDLRCRYHESVTVMQMQAECAPCFHHQRVSYFPKNRPCSTLGRCPVIDSLMPQQVLASLRERIEGGKNFNHRVIG
jgi:ADP-heptose:LPS heptosyltransferase